MIQNCFKILEFFKSFIAYKWITMYTWFIKKSYNLEYNKTKECKILVFGDNLKNLSFKKIKHWIYKEFAHLKKSIFIQ